MGLRVEMVALMDDNILMECRPKELIHLRIKMVVIKEETHSSSSLLKNEIQ